MTFALFFPLSLTAGASLLVVLLSRELEHPTSFLIVSMGGTIVTTLAVWNWWFVTNRRQEVRTALIAYQEKIANELGGALEKQKIFDEPQKRSFMHWQFLETLYLSFLYVVFFYE